MIYLTKMIELEEIALQKLRHQIVLVVGMTVLEYAVPPENEHNAGTLQVKQNENRTLARKGQ